MQRSILRIFVFLYTYLYHHRTLYHSYQPMQHSVTAHLHQAVIAHSTSHQMYMRCIN